MSGDWGKLAIPNLAGMYLIRCYSVLRNVRVTVFIVSELLRVNQQDGEMEGERVELNLSPTPLHPHTQIRVKLCWIALYLLSKQ